MKTPPVTTSKMIRLDPPAYESLQRLRDLWSRMDSATNARQVQYTLQSTAASAIAETLARVEAQLVKES